MDVICLSCPLCCGKTFDSKQALVQHLSTYTKTFTCPLCCSNFTSVPDLVHHLSHTDCSTGENEISLSCVIDKHSVTNGLNNESIQKSTAASNNEELDDFNDNGVEDHDISELQGDTLESSNMYATLEQYKTLSGGDMDSLEQNGHSKYTIVAHNGAPAIMSGGSVITKQNSDGTISITTAKDDKDEIVMNPNMKLEPEPIITMTEKDPQADGDEGVYSCNMCGVSFLSVLEHIQNYHKDQDVVVEVNDQGGTEGGNPCIEFAAEEGMTKDAPSSDPFEFVSIQHDTKEHNQGHSQEPDESAPRRMITDTGDIIETSVSNKSVVIEIPSPTKNIPLASLEEDVVDKKGRVFRRKLVQIDKVNVADTEADPLVKPPVKQPYHQVVVKEIVTMDGNKKMKVYNCIACNIYVTELEEFKSHPCKSLKYTCPHCPVSYENAKSLCAHMKVHKGIKQINNRIPPTGSANVKKEDSSDTVPTGTAGPYKCDMCCTIFPSNKSLKLHRRMHDPVKPRLIEPPVHEEITEENPEKYFCTVCTKWIPTGYRDVHDNFHDSPENFNCEICNKKFESSNYLAMHMGVHNMDKSFQAKKPDKSLPYTCLYCNRQFARPHEKVKHERIHTGEKPHTCEICGKAFRVSYCLTLHMRTHTGARPYGCHHCGKRFKAHSVYNHHLLTHSDVRAYKCPYCPKAFKTSVQLAGHKNSHTKPFSCEHCNRPFASLYAVRVHQETHRRQNNLKFSCSLCGASYARSFALKDHVKQAHPTEIENPDSFVVNLNKESWVIGEGEELDSKEGMHSEMSTLEISPNEEAVVA